MTERKKYRIAIKQTVLKHLGMNLYSSVPAVLSEVVANSWDADATRVEVTIKKRERIIVISDNGCGMDLDDINEKYLAVGYERRKDRPTSEKYGRKVMGRKGIGKLSLFSVADVIEVHTLKDAPNSSKQGFRIVVKELERQVSENENSEYEPAELKEEEIEIQTPGTTIYLKDLKKRMNSLTESSLKRKLARRFSIIGEKHDFRVFVNGEEVRPEDRDYYDKVEYAWIYRYPQKSEEPSFREAEEIFPMESESDGSIFGWIGTVKNSGNLLDKEEGADDGFSLNRIVVLVRGKVAHENILEYFAEGGLYTKYLIGEIHADFLDENDEPDITTTNRQQIIEDDSRFISLRDFVRDQLKRIQREWTDLRNEKGTAEATSNPQIEEWYRELGPDKRRKADVLFGKINRVTDQDEEKHELFAQGVLAFERLKHKDNLDELDSISLDNLEVFLRIFSEIEDYSAVLYHSIISDRLRIIGKLREDVEANVLEKVLQRYLFDNLWLLDPSWDKVTSNAVMEKAFKKLEGFSDESLTDEEKNARLDIKYRAVSGKHVIIELKRSGKSITSNELIKQVMKYDNAFDKYLTNIGKAKELFEIVCVLGKEPVDWHDTPNSRNKTIETLKINHARIVFYDELIVGAYNRYEEFLESDDKVKKTKQLIDAIANEYSRKLVEVR